MLTNNSFCVNTIDAFSVQSLAVVRVSNAGP